MKSRRLLTTLVLASSVGAADAAILFADSFDRANSGAGFDDNTIKGPIDASLDGITNNTGTVFTVNSGATAGAADNVYSRPFIGGGAGILNNELQFASGPGATNAFVNHNFTNASILAGGGFSVTTTITSIFQTTNSQGGGFGLGMTLAEAQSAGDGFQGATKMTDGLGASTGSPAGSGSVAISDFWVTLRGDGSMSWGGLGNTNGVNVITGLGDSGTISANFTGFADFNSGTSVNYEVFFNGLSQGSGTFAWSDTGANYIGLDARDSTSVTLDNFSVDIIPEPGAALLGSLGLLGLLRRRR